MILKIAISKSQGVLKIDNQDIDEDNKMANIYFEPANPSDFRDKQVEKYSFWKQFNWNDSLNTVKMQLAKRLKLKDE